MCRTAFTSAPSGVVGPSVHAATSQNDTTGSDLQHRATAGNPKDVCESDQAKPRVESIPSLATTRPDHRSHGPDVLSSHRELTAETTTYRLNAMTGQATVVSEDIEKPNGLCFAPDYKRLYVVDTGDTPPGKPHPIFVFDVVDASRLANRRVFYDMGAGNADGIRCDRDGNVWAAAGWVGDRTTAST